MANKDVQRINRASASSRRGLGLRGFPIQPDGMPSGKHMAGFKGMKLADGVECNCGGCRWRAKNVTK
jgi:hypothetical protein